MMMIIIILLLLLLLRTNQLINKTNVTKHLWCTYTTHCMLFLHSCLQAG